MEQAGFASFSPSICNVPDHLPVTLGVQRATVGSIAPSRRPANRYDFFMAVLLRMRLRAVIDPQIRSGRAEIQSLCKKRIWSKFHPSFTPTKKRQTLLTI